MRAYFKNDLYSLAAQRDRDKQAEANKKEQERLALKKKAREETTGKVTTPTAVDDSLGIQLVKSENNPAADNGEDLGELMKSMKKRAPDSESKRDNRNVLAGGYQPRSSLVIKEEPKLAKKTEEQERKQRKQTNIEFKKMENDIKRAVGVNPPAEAPEGAEAAEADEGEEQTRNKEERTEEGKAEGKEAAKEESGEQAVKTKKIKKQANYQRLDLKRKYQDRFLGALHTNLRKFMRNGALRPKYRMQKELGLDEGEVYNSYISSLSKSLKLTLTVDDDDDEDSQANPQPQGPIWRPPADPSSREELTACLREYFGFQGFREGQFEVIQNMLGGRSTLFISETASGKSLTYILSAMLLGGLSLVVSPLVSLMLDQLEHLPLELTGACVSSLLNKEQQRSIAEQVKKGKINILFLTPEALQTDFLYHLEDFPEVNFVCVDEAHSLSELSHNFRTSFLTLGDIILHMVRYRSRRPTVLGLTATANTDAVQSVAQKLEIAQVVRSSSCMNKNLFVTVSRERGQLKYESLIRYLNDTLIAQCKGILVYTRTRRIMDEVFNYVTNSVAAKAAIYHSALSAKQKTETLERFREGSIRIVVATVALGMGLDFEHLECVIHLNMPKSIENYVQEIGRAGRRQRRAYCHLFLDENDYITERNYIIADEIEPSLLALIYQHLKDASVVRRPRTKKQSQHIRRMDEEVVIKRAAILIEHCPRQEIIYEEEEEQLESEAGSAEAESPVGAPKVNSQLFSIRISKLVELTQLKEEAILTLILKIEYLLREDSEVRFRVLPTANEMLKIGFYKSNEQEIRTTSPFFRKLVEGCRRVKGSIYVPLIEKCNDLALKPVQLLTQLYRLKDQYWLKVEEDNPIFVWQFEGRRLDLDEGIDHELGQLVDRGFDRLMGGEFIERVVGEMREVQQTALVKLNALWSLAFLHSRNHITNVLQGRLLPRHLPIPPDGLPADLDRYFHTSLLAFYDHLTAHGEEIFIPTSQVDPKEIEDIHDCVQLFFKHEMSNEGELRGPGAVSQARRRVVERYENGKVLTKILMGVNSGEVSWKIYGERTYWMAFKLKNYAELLEVVREQIQRYKEDHRRADAK